VLHGLQDRLFGNGVEHHALDFLALQRAFFLQNLQHMPGNGLAFAVRVSCQDKPVITLQGICNIG
jgi:hypothetical protein